MDISRQFRSFSVLIRTKLNRLRLVFCAWRFSVAGPELGFVFILPETGDTNKLETLLWMEYL